MEHEAWGLEHGAWSMGLLMLNSDLYDYRNLNYNYF